MSKGGKVTNVNGTAETTVLPNETDHIISISEPDYIVVPGTVEQKDVKKQITEEPTRSFVEMHHKNNADNPVLLVKRRFIEVGNIASDATSLDAAPVISPRKKIESNSVKNIKPNISSKCCCIIL
jgi:hypothetical protein